MRKLLMACVFLASYVASAQEDYIITVDGKPIAMAANKDYTINVKGKDVTINLKLKEILTYSDELFSFEYPQEYKVSKVQLDAGIEQIILMTADGAGFLIQKYSTLNPQAMNELVLAEVTKESVSYGYEMTRANHRRKISSGQELNVINAVLTYNDEYNNMKLPLSGRKMRVF